MTAPALPARPPARRDDGGGGVASAAPWTLIVCGGRDYNNGARVWDVLDGLSFKRGAPALLRHGAARGADGRAEFWARKRGIPSRQYPADWATHGPAAGPIRNAAMLADGADLVVAFPGGRGTADMVRKAKAAGVPVVEVPA